MSALLMSQLPVAFLYLIFNFLFLVVLFYVFRLLIHMQQAK